MAPGGYYGTARVVSDLAYFDAPTHDAYAEYETGDARAFAIAMNRINFLKFYTRFKEIVDCKRIVFVFVRAFERRITRQHKTRQVKNL